MSETPDTPTDPYAEALLQERAQVAFWHPDDKDRLAAIDAELKAQGVKPPKASAKNASRSAQRKAAEAKLAAGMGQDPDARDASEDPSGDAAPEPTGAAGDPGSA